MGCQRLPGSGPGSVQARGAVRVRPRCGFEVLRLAGCRLGGYPDCVSWNLNYSINFNLYWTLVYWLLASESIDVAGPIIQDFRPLSPTGFGP